MKNRIQMTNGMIPLLAVTLFGAAMAGLAFDASADQHGAESDTRSEPVLPEENLDADRAEARASNDSWAPVRYVPPSRGKARDTAAGGTRGIARKGQIDLAVLAPRDHVALTTRAQPTLYWYVSKTLDSRIDVTLVDDSSIDPLLEMTLAAPVEAGIHALDLAGHGLELEPGRVYSWNVAIVADANRRSNDLLAEGFIERIGVSGELERSLSKARNPYAPYALSGIWYDAIAEIRRAIAAAPADRKLRLQEVALLEQAELSEVARYAMKQDRR